jgi:hypothetical protein
MDGMKSFGPMGKMGGLGFAVMGDGDLTPGLMDTLMKAAMAAVQGFTDAVDDEDCEGCDYRLCCSRCDDACESHHYEKRWKHITGHIDNYLLRRDELTKNKEGDFETLIKPQYHFYTWEGVIGTLRSQCRSLGSLMDKIQRLIENWEDSVSGEYFDNLAEDLSNHLSYLGYEIDDEDYSDIEEYLSEKVFVTVDQERLLSLAFLE